MNYRRINAKSIIPIFVLIFSIILCYSLGFSVHAQNYSGSPSEVNVILLLDNTGSMNGNDRSKISIASAKNFIEYLAMARRFSEVAGENVPFINVGVYTFSDEANEICPLTDITNTSKVEDMIRSVNAIEYRASNTGATYYGPALNAAYNALPTAKANCKNIVFLFTDGKPDGKNPNSEENRPDNAVVKLNDSDVEVMVLGLDANQSIDDNAKQLIFRIANETQREEGICTRAGNDQSANGFTKSNYYIANAADETLNQFLSDIASKMIGNASIPVQNNEIIVDKRELVIVNIFKVDKNESNIDYVGLKFGNQAVELEQTDTYPELNGLTDFVDNTFTILYSGRSAFLTMYAPALGKYYLDLPDDVKFDVRYVAIDVAHDYSIDLEIKKEDEVQNESTCFVSITCDGVPVAGLEDKITLKATGSDTLRTNTAEFGSVVYNNLTGKYEVKLTVGLPGEYKVLASFDEAYHTDDNSVSSEQTVTFESKRPPADEVNINVVVNKERMIEFPTEYYPDWPGVSYTSSIANLNPEFVRLTQLDDGSYSIRGISLAEGRIVDKITDTFGNEYVLTYNIKVVQDPLPIILIVGGALTALGALGVVARCKITRPLPGDFALEYDGERFTMITPPKGAAFSAMDVCNKCDSFPTGNMPTNLKNKLKKLKIVTRRVERIGLGDEYGSTTDKIKTYCVKGKKSYHDLNNNPYRIDYKDNEGRTEQFIIEYFDGEQ